MNNTTDKNDLLSCPGAAAGQDKGIDRRDFFRAAGAGLTAATVVLSPAERALARRREDARQAQRPPLEVTRRNGPVGAGGERLHGAVEEAIEGLVGGALGGEDQGVLGEVAAEQDPLEAPLQAVRRPEHLHAAHAHQVAVVALQPGDVHLGERLELPGEAAVAPPRAAGSW